ncbi:MAG: hypothetical protein ACLP8B_13950, partial [Xanthobacteraceae bacterium]
QRNQHGKISLDISQSLDQPELRGSFYRVSDVDPGSGNGGRHAMIQASIAPHRPTSARPACRPSGAPRFPLAEAVP